jgi:hypothetical protein
MRKRPENVVALSSGETSDANLGAGARPGGNQNYEQSEDQNLGAKHRELGGRTLARFATPLKLKSRRTLRAQNTADRRSRSPGPSPFPHHLQPRPSFSQPLPYPHPLPLLRPFPIAFSSSFSCSCPISKLPLPPPPTHTLGRRRTYFKIRLCWV